MQTVDGVLDLEQTEKLFEFLKGGDPPDGITLSRRPRKMTPDQAFGLIYVLQEAFHVVHDTIEMCCYCGYLFDTDSAGHIAEDGKYFCDGCSHNCRCKDCNAEYIR
jgi:hypothetical protein